MAKIDQLDKTTGTKILRRNVFANFLVTRILDHVKVILPGQAHIRYNIKFEISLQITILS